jgi:peroxiredoxin Q/BCP
VNVEAGDPAPQFTLKDHGGNEVSLQDFRGRPVVLYFYPKDDSPGCTTQACDIRDRWGEFEDIGAVVVGVSPDGADTHRAFRDKYDLPQILLADPDHEVMERYGAWGEKVLYGKKSVGAIRSSVLVGPDGEVVKVWKRAQARSHAERVLRALQDMA